MLGVPFVGFYIVGAVMDSSQDYLIKFLILLMAYGLLYLFGNLFFDERLMNVFPMAIYLSTKVRKGLKPKIFQTFFLKFGARTF